MSESDSEEVQSLASDSETGSEEGAGSQDEDFYEGGFGDLARFEEFRLAKGLKDLIEQPKDSGIYY